MAGVYAAGSAIPRTTTVAPIAGKSLIIASSLPSTFPSRRRRTNHLRQKILKTLENKPYPNPSNPQFPQKTLTTSIEETSQQQITEIHQFSSSETTGFTPRSVAKIGLFLFGAFIFQTICFVFIFGSNDLDDKDDDDKNSRVSDLNIYTNNESKLKPIVLVDESEIDNKITEIQQMAREAREIEKLDAKRKGLVSEGKEDVDYELIDKTLKEKEVDHRLMKMRKSLEGNYENLSPKFLIKKSDVSKGEEGFDSLMFKKKYKYKSPSIESGDKPKGFTGNGSLISSDNGIDILDNNDFPRSEICDKDNQEESKMQESVDESIGFKVPENKLNRIEKEKPRASKPEIIAGTSKDQKFDKEVGRAAKYGKSSNMETRKPRGFGKESQSDNSTSIKHGNNNDSLKGKRGGNRKSAKLGDMKFSPQNDFWWTSLPYVLAVLMQRDGNGEDSEGLFTLKNESGLSHTVAFEDRGDATNFSYLLESFFQDLGDFSTSLIPIPTNELEDAIKSEVMKVVVVKKGQLQLYIGQPLTDVESALRKLIEQ